MDSVVHGDAGTHLATGPHWGWPVAGTHVTKRLLIRGAGVAVTLWTLMGGALQSGLDL